MTATTCIASNTPAIRTVFDIDFSPEVIGADMNIATLTRRILASKQLLEL